MWDFCRDSRGISIILALPAILSVSGIAGCGNGSDSDSIGKEADLGTIGTRADVDRPLASGNLVFDGVGRLTLDISNGTVLCRDTNLAPGQVRAVWRFTRNGESLNGDSDNIEIRHEQDGSDLRIWDHSHRRWRNGSPEVDMRIQVHPEVQIDAGLGNGDIELDVPLIAGARLGNGTLKLNGRLLEHASAEVGNGLITGEVEVPGGDHRLSVGNGEIRLFLGEGSSADIRASVGVGSVDVSGIKVRRDWNLLGGTVRGSAGSGDGALTLDLGTGSIKLDVVQPVSAN